MATKNPLDLQFARVRKAVATRKLPGVEDARSYDDTPSLKAHGKFMARMKEHDTLVVMCPLEDKEMLMEAAPHIYFETDHYKGWPAILVRLSKIEPEELMHRLEIAWRMRAPKRAIKAFDEQG